MMLFNLKWARKTKADPLTLEAFIAWLETQNPEQTYDWYDPNRCLVCMYFDSAYSDVPFKERPRFRSVFGEGDRAFRLYHAVGRPWPWTVGGALHRARMAAVSLH